MWIAGLDLGGSKCAVSMFKGTDLVGIHACQFKGSRPASLHNVSRDIADWMKLFDEPDAIYIEEPYIGQGVRASMQLAQMAGAIMATLRRDTGCEMYLIPVSTWKKSVIGKGNVTKPQVSHWLTDTYPAYAAMCDADQDKIDAVCIGIYGQRNQAASLALSL